MQFHFEMLLLVQLKDSFSHQAYYGQTFLDPIGAAAVAVLSLLAFIVPRRLALIPVLLLICFVPCAQRVAVFGLDFNLMRILLIAAWSRMLMRGEIQRIEWTKLDKLVVAWAITETAVYLALYRNPGAFITMAGRMGEALGGYFMVRAFVRNWEDLRFLCGAIALIAVPTALTFVLEKSTGRNVFSFFGGIAEFTKVREGKLRAAGAIGNPILAGCFWASLLPMCASLFWSRRLRLLGIFGAVSAITIIFACASSTPLAAMLAAAAFGILVVWRHKLGQLRKWVLWSAVGLHILMETQGKPIWHLLARVDLVGGSTGYHRYYLVDEWIHRVLEWGPLGVKGTSHWGWGLADVTNQYVLESVRGGIWTIAIFVWMIVVAFRFQGVAWRLVEGNRERLALAWAIGVSVATHCVAFIAVSYFGQMNFVWYFHLAIVSSMYAYVKARETPKVEVGANPIRATSIPRRRRGLIGASRVNQLRDQGARA